MQTIVLLNLNDCASLSKQSDYTFYVMVVYMLNDSVSVFQYSVFNENLVSLFSRKCLLLLFLFSNDLM